MKHEVWIYNNGQHERELICAEKWLRLIYENPIGGATLPYLFSRKVLSRLYGIYCRTGFSAKSIPKFIKQNQVDMTGCQGPYKNFADFFSREKTGISFPDKSGQLGAPCEGFASIYTNILPEEMIAAKNSLFSLAELFGDESLAEAYRDGIMLRIRLAPANYHRMHFFDDGTVTGSKFLDGDLFSVSPLAVNRIARLYCRNKRGLIMFSSQHFGDVAIVEVGATFVGSIVHSFDQASETGSTTNQTDNPIEGLLPVHRGQQASYFLPGGSLVLVFFKKGAFIPNRTLLEQTSAGYETKICVGESIGEIL